MDCKSSHCINNKSQKCVLPAPLTLDEMGFCPAFERINQGKELNVVKNILYDKACSLLVQAKDAKQKHRASTQCSRTYATSCGGCHFWSGAIATLTDLLTLPSSIN